MEYPQKEATLAKLPFLQLNYYFLIKFVHVRAYYWG